MYSLINYRYLVNLIKKIFSDFVRQKFKFFLHHLCVCFITFFVYILKSDKLTKEDVPMYSQNIEDVKVCPLYGTCLGGPGGPTCCANRLISAPKLLDDIKKSDDMIEKPALTNVRSSIGKQLNDIYSSDLKLWIVDRNTKSNYSDTLSEHQDWSSKPANSFQEIDAK